eukprot:COSAG05_NODE_466_length_9533_cov_5.547806_13_plen_148_part_00
MNYKGAPEKAETVALIGKGLTFDTGGLNLKPGGSIETMYTDKHGACTVLGVMQALSGLKLKVNVLGCMALAENAIGENAQHPYDIVKSYKGLTVHIDNTDAEVNDDMRFMPHSFYFQNKLRVLRLCRVALSLLTPSRTISIKLIYLH